MTDESEWAKRNPVVTLLNADGAPLPDELQRDTPIANAIQQALYMTMYADNDETCDAILFALAPLFKRNNDGKLENDS